MSRNSQKKHLIYNRIHMGMMQYYAHTRVDLTPEGLALLAEIEKAGGWDQWFAQMPRVTKSDTFTSIADGHIASDVFTVVRKKDGEIVGIFETLGEANEAIEKARKGKKAALMLKE